jgi:hypothetical protein
MKIKEIKFDFDRIQPRRIYITVDYGDPTKTYLCPVAFFDFIPQFKGTDFSQRVVDNLNETAREAIERWNEILNENKEQKQD